MEDVLCCSCAFKKREATSKDLPQDNNHDTSRRLTLQSLWIFTPRGTNVTQKTPWSYPAATVEMQQKWKLKRKGWKYITSEYSCDGNYYNRNSKHIIIVIAINL
eukprot:13126-Amphidinium_carterae.1